MTKHLQEELYKLSGIDDEDPTIKQLIPWIDANFISKESVRAGIGEDVNLEEVIQKIKDSYKKRIVHVKEVRTKNKWTREKWDKFMKGLNYRFNRNMALSKSAVNAMNGTLHKLRKTLLGET